MWFALAPLTRCYIKIYSSGFTAAAEKKAGTKTPGSAGGRTRSVRKICHKEPRDQGDHGKWARSTGCMSGLAPEEKALAPPEQCM